MLLNRIDLNIYINEFEKIVWWDKLVRKFDCQLNYSWQRHVSWWDKLGRNKIKIGWQNKYSCRDNHVYGSNKPVVSLEGQLTLIRIHSIEDVRRVHSVEQLFAEGDLGQEKLVVQVVLKVLLGGFIA